MPASGRCTVPRLVRPFRSTLRPPVPHPSVQSVQSVAHTSRVRATDGTDRRKAGHCSRISRWPPGQDAARPRSPGRTPLRSVFECTGLTALCVRPAAPNHFHPPKAARPRRTPRRCAAQAARVLRGRVLSGSRLDCRDQPRKNAKNTQDTPNSHRFAFLAFSCGRLRRRRSRRVGGGRIGRTLTVSDGNQPLMIYERELSVTAASPAC
jgi:hypothetical protein